MIKLLDNISLHCGIAPADLYIVHYNKWHVLCRWSTKTEFGPDTPQLGATKGIFTPPPSQQDKGGEQRGKVALSLFIASLGLCQSPHTPWPFISSHWCEAAGRTHSPIQEEKGFPWALCRFVLSSLMKSNKQELWEFTVCRAELWSTAQHMLLIYCNGWLSQ